MRVLFIVTAYKRSERDVITPWMTETILELKKRGIDVEVFAPSYRGLGDQTVDGIRIRRFRYFPSRWESLTHDQATPDRIEGGWYFKVLVVFYLIGGVAGIIRLIRKERYDIFQVHWPFPNFIFAYVGKIFTGSKIVSSFHGVGLRWVKNKLPFLRPFLWWIIGNSDAVTANTPTTAGEIRSIKETDVEVIPYSIGLKGCGEGESIPVASGTGGNNILFVGRLVERKGADYLVRAVKRVAERCDVDLFIVGEGPRRGELENLSRELGIEDLVHFTGFVEQERLVEYFRDCTLFVLPAIYDRRGDTEGQGVVIVEAMSFGKPVVASKVGGIVDVVRDGETGILVEEKDEKALAEAIFALLEDPSLAREMGDRGYRLYRELYGWESISVRWSSLYERVMGGDG